MQQWLESNTTASTEEYEHKQKECESHFNQLAQKMYASTGGAGGMPDMSQFANMAGAGGAGGMPDMSQFAEMMKNGGMGANAQTSSPSVEEVD
jgi:L1 cell adhesion molecule like protein